MLLGKIFNPDHFEAGHLLLWHCFLEFKSKSQHPEPTVDPWLNPISTRTRKTCMMTILDWLGLGFIIMKSWGKKRPSMACSATEMTQISQWFAKFVLLVYYSRDPSAWSQLNSFKEGFHHWPNVQLWSTDSVLYDLHQEHSNKITGHFGVLQTCY